MLPFCHARFTNAGPLTAAPCLTMAFAYLPSTTAAGPRPVLADDSTKSHVYHRPRLPPKPCDYFGMICGTSTGA
ncbi:hypothetical protein BGZ61DRAFT_189238 [Ilyonectria robusta]|uniref:uncharacterized protein n=1 Tax=Ilyonectria robusta TaxID=1079257 RepID=UPI001E8DE2B8|nr:uncharacterized protein BGZ61DRAFT_189238 [Ilyonectria robusta]KAH8656452.1 hypothetical protein BGZ61DRAFT_189238 [Ilyonectria robusta]